jgi:hypothetical protein
MGRTTDDSAGSRVKIAVMAASPFTPWFACAILCLATMPASAAPPSAEPAATPGGAATPVTAAPSAPPGAAFYVALLPRDKPGIRLGTATVAQRGADVIVTIAMPGTPSEPGTGPRGAARIVRGTCAKPAGGGTAYSLAPVSNGRSQTVLHGMTVAVFVKGAYALLVDTSPGACGDLRLTAPLPARP